MKRYHHFLKGLQVLLIVLLVSCLLSIVPWQAPSFAVTSSEAMPSSDLLNQPNTQLQADVEKEKQAATAEAENSLDQEAIAAIEETQNAIAAIEQGKTRMQFKHWSEQQEKLIFLWHVTLN